MDTPFITMYIGNNMDLKSYTCNASNIGEVIAQLPKEITMESIICIKKQSWDELI